MLKGSGIDVFIAYDVDTAFSIVTGHDLDFIITDLKMPGKSGMDLVELVRREKPFIPVIMVTAHGSIENAVAAVKRGAYDFIAKPFDEDELLNVARKALSESRKNRELISAFFEGEGSFSAGIIGKTGPIEQILQTVRKIAPTDSTVLITGETGVGKELIARAIHLASSRRDRPLIKVNCAAIPENLVESELFGYEKGAFTGASTSKPGKFEIADGGTIFLDEIAEIPLHLQAKLLGVLQDKAFERVGGIKTIKVDVRIVAACNKDLQSAVRSGTFRTDLFYRLNVVPIYIPPLRERIDDLSPLVDHFLHKFSTKYQKSVKHLRPEVIAAFANYGWPGNIRELENVMERMILMSESEILGLDLIPGEIGGSASSAETFALKSRMEAVSHVTEKQMIIEALKRTDQNRTKAAELLGISRRTLQNKIKEYGL